MDLIARQGDVLIFRVDAIPESVKHAPDGRIREGEMTEQEARQFQRKIEDMLDGNEIGFLKAEESEYMPGHWGVTIKLTDPTDLLILKRAFTGPTQPLSDKELETITELARAYADA